MRTLSHVTDKSPKVKCSRSNELTDSLLESPRKWWIFPVFASVITKKITSRVPFHKSSETSRENIKGVKCNPFRLSARNARGTFGCGVLIAQSQKPTRYNELRWLWCLATLSMILQENLSRKRFPRFLEPVRRINVHSSLMPLKSCVGGTHHRVCGSQNGVEMSTTRINSSGFPHRPSRRCNLSPNRFHSKSTRTVNHNLGSSGRRLTVMCANHY